MNTSSERRRPRGAPPKRTLIGPLVMLAGGLAAGVMLWRVLMLDEPSPRAASDPITAEHLSNHDRQTLEHLIEGRRARQ